MSRLSVLIRSQKLTLVSKLLFIFLLILITVGRSGFKLESIILFISLFLFTIVAQEDLRSGMIGWKVLFVGIVSSIFYFLLINGFDQGRILMTLLSAVSLPLLTALISREKWMGYADPLLALWGGLICIYPLSIFMIIFAYSAGALFGIIILKLNAKTKQLPFAPFLLLGVLLSLAFSGSLTEWYSSLF